MKKIAIASLLSALMSTAAFAGDFAMGGFSGGSMTSAHSGSMAASGGIAAHGMTGNSSVANQSGAGQIAGAQSSLSFDVQAGGSFTTPGNNGVGNQCQGNSCGQTITRPTSITVTQINESFTEGFSYSDTQVANTGKGTVGLAGGLAAASGSAFATGGYKGFGSTRW